MSICCVKLFDCGREIYLRDRGHHYFLLKYSFRTNTGCDIKQYYLPTLWWKKAIFPGICCFIRGWTYLLSSKRKWNSSTEYCIRFQIFIVHSVVLHQVDNLMDPRCKGNLEWLMTEFLQPLLFSWCLVITRLVDIFSRPPVLMQSTKLRWIGILPTQSVSLYLCKHV